MSLYRVQPPQGPAFYFASYTDAAHYVDQVNGLYDLDLDEDQIEEIESLDLVEIEQRLRDGETVLVDQEPEAAEFLVQELGRRGLQVDLRRAETAEALFELVAAGDAYL